jgi:5-methylcytosine-specific restriction protein A
MNIVPLSKGKQDVDPQKDLLPVCPNCHAMLHWKRGNDPRTVEELMKIMQKGPYL